MPESIQTCIISTEHLTDPGARLNIITSIHRICTPKVVICEWTIRILEYDNSTTVIFDALAKKLNGLYPSGKVITVAKSACNSSCTLSASVIGVNNVCSGISTCSYTGEDAES